MGTDFIKKGCLLDISRYRVPTIARIKLSFERIASYGYNEIFFNIEHVFKIDKHPLVGAESDGYTEAEFKELDDFAASLGLTLIPVFQSFGHMFHILKWSCYTELSETDDKWSVRPDYAKTYELLEDFYTALARTFRSEYIHVGGDEVYDLGAGKSKHLIDAGKTKKQLFIEHFVHIQKILTGLGKKIMLWGDMLEAGEEGDGGNLLEELGPEAIICYWNYHTYPMPDFYASIKNKIYVCPGIHTWRGSFFRKHIAEANLAHIYKESQKITPYGFIITDWGDCGHIHPPVFTEKLFEWAIPFFTGGRTSAPLGVKSELHSVIDILDDIHAGAYLNDKPVSEYVEHELVTRLLYHEYVFRGRGFTGQTSQQLQMIIDKVDTLEKEVNSLPEGILKGEFEEALALFIDRTYLLRQRVKLHLAYRNGAGADELENEVTDYIIKNRRWFADYMKNWHENSRPMGLYFLIHYNSLTEKNMLDELEVISERSTEERKNDVDISIYDVEGYKNLYNICDLKSLNHEWEKYRI